MKCPFCSHFESKVNDSRPVEDGSAIRRRRECLKCEQRFTTYEKVEMLPIIIIKKDSTREQFDKNKVLNGIIKSCEKRPVSFDKMDKIADDVEYALSKYVDKEVPSEVIGEIIMDKLKEVDQVAYVRFASVYKEFTDISSFTQEIAKLLDDKEAHKNGK